MDWDPDADKLYCTFGGGTSSTNVPADVSELGLKCLNQEVATGDDWELCSQHILSPETYPDYNVGFLANTRCWWGRNEELTHDKSYCDNQADAISCTKDKQEYNSFCRWYDGSVLYPIYDGDMIETCCQETNLHGDKEYEFYLPSQNGFSFCESVGSSSSLPFYNPLYEDMYATYYFEGTANEKSVQEGLTCNGAVDKMNDSRDPIHTDPTLLQELSAATVTKCCGEFEFNQYIDGAGCKISFSCYDSIKSAFGDGGPCSTMSSSEICSATCESQLDQIKNMCQLGDSKNFDGKWGGETGAQECFSNFMWVEFSEDGDFNCPYKPFICKDDDAYVKASSGGQVTSCAVGYDMLMADGKSCDADSFTDLGAPAGWFQSSCPVMCGDLRCAP
jgi:hypothetical protein